MQTKFKPGRPMSQARSTLVSPTEHALIIQANELIKAKKVQKMPSVQVKVVNCYDGEKSYSEADTDLCPAEKTKLS
jgi:hypothetical protein